MTRNKTGFLTCAEVADQLGFTADHVRQMVINGRIKAERAGHIWLIRPRDIAHIKRVRHPKPKEAEHGSDQ